VSDPSPPCELLHAPNLERRQTDASADASPAVASKQSVVAGVVATDQSQKRAAVVGALLLGHKSSHQRALRLTVTSGVKQARLTDCPNDSLLTSDGARARDRFGEVKELVTFTAAEGANRHCEPMARSLATPGATTGSRGLR
jgi:hypothetical protein